MRNLPTGELFNYEGKDFTISGNLTDGGGKSVIKVTATIGSETRSFYIQAAGMWNVLTPIVRVLGTIQWSRGNNLFIWIQQRLQTEDLVHPDEDVRILAQAYFKSKKEKEESNDL